MAKAPKMHRALWSKGDIRTLRALCKQKLGVDKIAKQMNRSAWSVRNRAYAEGLSLSTR